jgi:glycosyltransferase involved in cell wall biosynthesis
MPDALAGIGESEYRGAGRLRALGSVLVRAAAAPAAFGFVAELRDVVRRLRPRLIHSNGVKAHLLSRLVRSRGVPVVWHLHDFCGLRPLTARCLRNSCRGASAIAVSEAVARDAAASLPGTAVRVVRNAVDVDHFAPGPGDPAALDAAANLAPSPSGTIRVGLVATYARWKGHDVFLGAAARRARDAPDLPLRFYVVGGPIYRTRAQYSLAELRELARSLGLGEQVGFVPFVSDPAVVYRALDVVVHASTLPEPSGLTILEAMSCGRAVVAAAAGGAAEAFTDGHDAAGFAPGDAEALAATIQGLAADRDRRERLGRNARATAVRDFHPARFARELIASYDDFLPNSERPRT